MRRREYHQYCGLAKALDLVGERWTLLIVRSLILGGRRYSELLRGLPGMTTNLLAKRLHEMAAAGLIERTEGSDGGHTYRLTKLGESLEPAVHALSRWGWSTMTAPGGEDLRSFDFLMVALRRRYRGGHTIRAEFVADGDPYRVILNGRKADISRGDVTSPDVVIRGKGSSFMRLLTDESARKRWPADIEVEGRAGDARAVIGAFAPSDEKTGTMSR